MFEFKNIEMNGTLRLALTGRIDSISSNQIEKLLQEKILAGERTILVDFNEVNYVSSAGLRVFFKYQKQLMVAAGEIIIIGMSDYVFDIFKSSGFHQFFKIMKDEAELAYSTVASETKTEKKLLYGSEFDIKTIKSSKPAELKIFGQQEKSALCSFSREDVVSIRPQDMQYCCGMATLGDSYDDFKDYFGEAIILNKSLFYYPAVRKPAVDFNIYTEHNSNVEYHFLHGFGFSGNPSQLISFECKDGFIDLNSLTTACSEICGFDLFGISAVTELKGLWGMNMRQVPIADNKPQNGKNVFDQENFSEWMNFPVEPTNINNIAAITGIVSKNKSGLVANIQALLPGEATFHIHAAIFERTLLLSNTDEFNKQLNSICNDQEAYLVQHLLGKTLFKSGMISIIELKA